MGTRQLLLEDIRKEDFTTIKEYEFILTLSEDYYAVFTAQSGAGISVGLLNHGGDMIGIKNLVSSEEGGSTMEIEHSYHTQWSPRKDKNRVLELYPDGFSSFVIMRITDDEFGLVILSSDNLPIAITIFTIKYGIIDKTVPAMIEFGDVEKFGYELDSLTEYKLLKGPKLVRLIYSAFSDKANYEVYSILKRNDDTYYLSGDVNCISYHHQIHEETWDQVLVEIEAKDKNTSQYPISEVLNPISTRDLNRKSTPKVTAIKNITGHPNPDFVKDETSPGKALAGSILTKLDQIS